MKPNIFLKAIMYFTKSLEVLTGRVKNSAIILPWVQSKGLSPNFACHTRSKTWWWSLMQQWKIVNRINNWMSLSNETYLRGCSYENSFPVVLPLNWEKDIISSSSYTKYFPACARFIFVSVRWENLERSQYSKWVT